MSQNLFQKVFNSSPRRRSWWIFAMIILLALAAGLVSGGNYYNQFRETVATASKNYVLLPKVREVPFRLGLDLQGGTQLVYEADVKNVPDSDKSSALEGVRGVVERRVNVFGVSEPIVQVNKTMAGNYRIIAELAGVKDVKEAIKMIGETPLLEFKEQSGSGAAISIPSIDGLTIETDKAASSSVKINDQATTEPVWINTELTGKHLKRAVVNFNPNDGAPEVSLEFNDEGAKLFEDITARNIGRPVAIFLDGYPISVPNVQSKISGGKASISGTFSAQEAKLLAQRLNTGALPVPISLISQQTVGATLGQESVTHSIEAGLIALLVVAVFMIFFYRLPGLLSVFALLIYGLISLAVFKLWPVTLTLSGIAGFILSIGMAVDANILIFERLKEELRAGKDLSRSIADGFSRAWPSIRDSNITTIIVCFVLILSSSSVIKGFAFTLLLGVLISMFTAIIVTRNFLKLINPKWLTKYHWLVTTVKRQ